MNKVRNKVHTKDKRSEVGLLNTEDLRQWSLYSSYNGDKRIPDSCR